MTNTADVYLSNQQIIFTSWLFLFFTALLNAVTCITSYIQCRYLGCWHLDARRPSHRLPHLAAVIFSWIPRTSAGGKVSGPWKWKIFLVFAVYQGKVPSPSLLFSYSAAEMAVFLQPAGVASESFFFKKSLSTPSAVDVKAMLMLPYRRIREPTPSRRMWL